MQDYTKEHSSDQAATGGAISRPEISEWADFTPSHTPQQQASEHPRPRLLYSLGSLEHRLVWTAEVENRGGLSGLPLEPGRYTLIQFQQDDANPAALERMLKPAERLCALPEHDHVATVLAVTSSAEGDQVWAEHLPGGSLAGLLTAREKLEPAEITTLAMGLIRGVQWLHRQQMGFEKLQAQDLGFSASGQPKLIVADRELRGAPASVAEDAMAENWAQVGQLLWRAMCGQSASLAAASRTPLSLLAPEYAGPVGPLVESLIDRTANNTALDELVSALKNLAPPGQIDLFASAHPSEHGLLKALPNRQTAASAPMVQKSSLRNLRRDTKTSQRGIKVASFPKKPIFLAGAGLLVALLLGGIFWAGQGAGSETEGQVQAHQQQKVQDAVPQATPQDSASAEAQQNPSSTVNLTEELAGLINQRNRVLAQGKVNLISSYAVPESQIAEADMQLVAADAGGELATKPLSLLEARILEETRESAKAEAVLVADGVSAEDVAETDNPSLYIVEGQVQQRLIFYLESGQQGWRLSEVRPAS